MKNYAIIGGGRLARHFAHYFQLLCIPHTCWSRSHDPSFNTHVTQDAESRLRQTIDHADSVLLLVSDDAIASVLKKYPFLHDKQLIHCSGSLSFPGVAGVHPLMTFADQLYLLDTYRAIAFICEAGNSFKRLFPDLPNPHHTVNIEDKAHYHALSVMAGNFPQILWESVANHFEHQLGLPPEILHPYLKQLAVNFVRAPDAALSGPLVRGDTQTVRRNIASLQGDPLQELYRAFTNFYCVSTATDQALESPMKEQAR